MNLGTHSEAYQMFAAFPFSLHQWGIPHFDMRFWHSTGVLTLVVVLVFCPSAKLPHHPYWPCYLNLPMTPYNPRACSWCSGRPCATSQCNPSSCQLRFAFWAWSNCPETFPLWRWPISWILVSGLGFIHGPYLFCVWFALASNMVCVSHLVCWGVGGPLRHIAT